MPKEDGLLNIRLINYINYKASFTDIFICFFFLLTKASNIVKELDNYHYTEWPATGFPDEPQTVMSIIEKVNHEHPSSDWPILIYCK
jgi:hypothetical protein